MKVKGLYDKETKRYIPTIGEADWDIKSLSKEEKNKIKRNIVVGITHNEEDYKTVIGYIHEKYWDLMDKNPDGMNLQWQYSTWKNKASLIDINNGDSKSDWDMYAFIYYDEDRDMEPIAFSGSHFRYAYAVDDPETHEIIEGQRFIEDGDHEGKTIIGMGYVLFIDPNYRRMGLANDLWISEAELYRRYGVRFQKEIQNSHSIEVTKSMFDDPEKCIITSPGRLKNDGTRAGIRCLLDYTDESLIRSYNEMSENLKDIEAINISENKNMWRFLEREGFNKEYLLNKWNIL